MPAATVARSSPGPSSAVAGARTPAARELVGAVLVEHRQQHLVVGLHRLVAGGLDLRAVAGDELKCVVGARQQDPSRRRGQPLQPALLDALVRAEVDELVAGARRPYRVDRMAERDHLDPAARQRARDGHGDGAAADEDRRRQVPRAARHSEESSSSTPASLSVASTQVLENSPRATASV